MHAKRLYHSPAMVCLLLTAEVMMASAEGGTVIIPTPTPSTPSTPSAGDGTGPWSKSDIDDKELPEDEFDSFLP